MDGALFNKTKSSLLAYPTGKSNKSYVVPSSVTRIEESALRGHHLERIELPVNLVSVGTRAFEGGQLTAVSLPAKVTVVGRSAFANNQISDINLPSGLVHVAANVLQGNKLTSVTIPASVADINDSAFADNQSLSSVTFLGNAPDYTSDNAFYGAASGAKAYRASLLSGFGDNGSIWKGLTVAEPLP
jgi:hypothetical protein